MRLSKLMSHPLPPLAGRRVSRLQAMDGFGSNPGNLLAKMFVPDGLPTGAALVVVLHGCTQTAAGYDTGAGWSELAERHGFAVLYPEQRRANNANLCLNWFEPGDIRRGAGEAASIRQMVAHAVASAGVDPGRVFITGLSAGAAMAAVMLATYPEVFAGGGLIAGLPYGTAQSMQAALQRMRGRGSESDAALSALVRGASDHQGPWPRVSVWHGGADTTVDASNADATVAQWCGVHGIDTPAIFTQADGVAHSRWYDGTGALCVEEYRIAGMGHGTPIDPNGPDGCGLSGSFLIDMGVSSTHRIAEFWGLLTAEPRQSRARTAAEPHARHRANVPSSFNVQTVIEDALKSAGLMR